MYRFRGEYSTPEMRDFLRDARELAEVPALRAPGGRDADGPRPRWYAVEAVAAAKIAKGDTVEVPDVVAASKGILTAEVDGVEHHVFVESAGPEALDSFKRRIGVEAENDARTVALHKEGGVRARDFNDAVDLQAEVKFSDWPVSGPCTGAWCLQFLKRRGGPASPHEWWKSNAKRSPSDSGVAEHETAMRAVTDALQYDQLVMVCLAAFEHLLGRALLV